MDEVLLEGEDLLSTHDALLHPFEVDKDEWVTRHQATSGQVDRKVVACGPVRGVKNPYSRLEQEPKQGLIQPVSPRQPGVYPWDNYLNAGQW